MVVGLLDDNLGGCAETSSDVREFECLAERDTVALVLFITLLRVDWAMLIKGEELRPDVTVEDLRLMCSAERFEKLDENAELLPVTVECSK